jgi:hypothetical protein
MSLSIERQLRRDLLIQASYAGKLSQKLEGHRFWDAAVFKPDPLTGASPSADKRFSHGFSFLGSYVFSKELNDLVSSNPGLTAGEDNPFNLKLDKGRGNYDHTHVFTFSWLWTQEHKFHQPFLKYLLENWSIGPTKQLRAVSLSSSS